MTRITDVGGDFEAESSGWLFKSPLAGGGGRYRPHSLYLEESHPVAERKR